MLGHLLSPTSFKYNKSCELKPTGGGNYDFVQNAIRFYLR